MPRLTIKKELLEGEVIKGQDFVIVRRTSAVVPTDQRIKIQKNTKKGRPPLPGKTRMGFVKAFERHHGNITKACRDAGIKSRATVYRWLKSSTTRNQKFRQHLKNTRALEAKKDFFEECLMEAAAKGTGNVTAIIFALKSIASDRGYSATGGKRTKKGATPKVDSGSGSQMT